MYKNEQLKATKRLNLATLLSVILFSCMFAATPAAAAQFTEKTEGASIAGADGNTNSAENTTGLGRKAFTTKGIIVAADGAANIEAREELERFVLELRKEYAGVQVAVAFTDTKIRRELADSSGETPSVASAISSLVDTGCAEVAILALHPVYNEGYDILEKTVTAALSVPGLLKKIQYTSPLVSGETDSINLASSLIYSAPEGMQKGDALIFAGYGSDKAGSLAYPALNWALMRQGERGSLYLTVNIDNAESIETCINIMKINRLNGLWIAPFTTFIDQNAHSDIFGKHQESISSKLAQSGLKAQFIEKGLVSNQAIQLIWKKKLKMIF